MTMAAMRRSGKAVAALVAGVLGVVSGFAAIASQTDLFLLGVPFFWLVAIALGIVSHIEIGRDPSGLSGRAFATWGMIVPLVGFGLGFLLLPAG